MPNSHREAIKPTDLQEEAGGATTTSSDKSSKTSDMYAIRELSPQNEIQMVEQPDGEGIRFTLTRGILLVVLLVASLFGGVATYYFIAKNDKTEVYERFETLAHDIIDNVQNNLVHQIDLYKTMSRHITTYVAGTGGVWPFVSLPHFEAEAQHTMEDVDEGLVLFQPLVSDDERILWEHYSVTQHEWIQEAMLVTAGDENTDVEVSRITPYIYDSLATRQSSPSNGDGFAPIWQVAPILERFHLINYNVFNATFFSPIYNKLIDSRDAVLSEVSNFDSNSYTEWPASWMAIPVSRDSGEESDLAAILSFVRVWHKEFQNSLPNENVNGIVIVVGFSCSQLQTYTVVGQDVVYLGSGDRHDARYNQLMVTRDLVGATTIDNCSYRLSIYPSTEYNAVANNTAPPIIYAAFASGLCVTVAIIYCAYICMFGTEIQRNSAPEESFVSDDTEDLKSNDLQTPNTSFDCVHLAESTSTNIADVESAAFSVTDSLRNDSRAFSATIVDSTTARATGGESQAAFADEFKDASVMFADIAGFAEWSASREPSSVFSLLATVYNAFDKIADHRHIFKVETLGDCYVGAAGLPDPVKNHATIIARFADECLKEMKAVVGNLGPRLGPGTEQLALRVGIHSGPVVAGVLQGEGKLRFQLLGDAVQLAALMLSTSFQNKIHTSPETARLMIEDDKSSWLKPRYSTVYIKEKESQTYWIEVDNTNSGPDGKCQRRISNYEIAKLEAKEADSSANMSGGGVVAIANASPHPRHSSMTHRRSSIGSRQGSFHSSNSGHDNGGGSSNRGFDDAYQPTQPALAGRSHEGSKTELPSDLVSPEGRKSANLYDGIQTVVEETAQQLQNMESPKLTREKLMRQTEKQTLSAGGADHQKAGIESAHGTSTLMEPTLNSSTDKATTKTGKAFPTILLDPGNEDAWSDSMSSRSDSSDMSGASSEDYSSDYSSPDDGKIVPIDTNVANASKGLAPMVAKQNPTPQDQTSAPLAAQTTGEHESKQASDNQLLVEQAVDILHVCLKMNAARKGGNVSGGTALSSEEGESTRILRISPVDEAERVLKFSPQSVGGRTIDTSNVELPPAVREQIKDYVDVIASTFEENAYHSFERAVYVMHSVTELFANIVTTNSVVEESPDDLGLTYKMKTDRGKLLEFTEGLTSDPLVQIAATLSALVQDACHPGIPSSQGVAGKTSLEVAWDLLMEPIYNDFRACIYTSMSEKERFRQLLLNAVVAADTVDKELAEKSKTKWGQAFRRRDSKAMNAPSTRDEIDLKSTLLLEHLVQTANVSHAIHDWSTYEKWSKRKLLELCLAHQKGLADRDPSDEFHVDELNFLDRVVLPLIRRLRECDALGPTSVEYLKAARYIRQEWSRKGPELVRRTAMKRNGN